MLLFVGWMVCSCVPLTFLLIIKKAASAEAGSGAWLLNARLSETPSETPTPFVHVAVFILDKSLCSNLDPALIGRSDPYRAAPLLYILLEKRIYQYCNDYSNSN